MVLPWCRLFQVPWSLKILIICGTSNPQLRPLLNMQSSIWNPLNNIYPCCSDPISVWYTYSKTTYVRALWIGNWIFWKVGRDWAELETDIQCASWHSGVQLFMKSQVNSNCFLSSSCLPLIDYLAQVENRKNYPTLSVGLKN